MVMKPYVNGNVMYGAWEPAAIPSKTVLEQIMSRDTTYYTGLFGQILERQCDEEGCGAVFAELKRQLWESE